MQWRREITPSFYEFPILSFSRPHLSAYPDPGHVAQARNFPRINVHAQKKPLPPRRRSRTRRSRQPGRNQKAVLCRAIAAARHRRVLPGLVGFEDLLGVAREPPQQVATLTFSVLLAATALSVYAQQTSPKAVQEGR